MKKNPQSWWFCCIIFWFDRNPANGDLDVSQEWLPWKRPNVENIATWQLIIPLLFSSFSWKTKSSLKKNNSFYKEKHNLLLCFWMTFSSGCSHCSQRPRRRRRSKLSRWAPRSTPQGQHVNFGKLWSGINWVHIIQKAPHWARRTDSAGVRGDAEWEAIKNGRKCLIFSMSFRKSWQAVTGRRWGVQSVLWIGAKMKHFNHHFSTPHQMNDFFFFFQINGLRT